MSPAIDDAEPCMRIVITSRTAIGEGSVVRAGHLPG
jgi:hypothetical protein